MGDVVENRAEFTWAWNVGTHSDWLGAGAALRGPLGVSDGKILYISKSTHMLDSIEVEASLPITLHVFDTSAIACAMRPALGNLITLHLFAELSYSGR